MGRRYASSSKLDASIVSFVAASKRVGFADPAEVDEYLRQGTNAFLDKDYRAALEILRALLLPIGDHESAAKRVAGVTEHKRRRHYGHAAWLVAACAALDPPPEATKWMAEIRAEHLGRA